MIRFKTARTAEEKQAFIDAYGQRSPATLSPVYLQNAQVRYLANSQGKMIAGYIVNTQAPLRYFDAFRNQDPVRLTHKIEELDACEITCVWMDKAYVSPLLRYFVYIQSTIDATRTDKKYVVGGALNSKVAAIQMKGMPYLIYHGPINNPSHGIGWYYFHYRSRIIGRLLLAIALECLSPLGSLVRKVSMRPAIRQIKELDRSKV